LSHKFQLLNVETIKLWDLHVFTPKLADDLAVFALFGVFVVGILGFGSVF